MRLTSHASGGESNVRAGGHKEPQTCSQGTSMLKVGLKLHKIGLMPEGGFEFPTWLSLLMRTSGIDYSQGMHLHEFSGAAGMVLPADHVYEIELELAIDASARFDPDTKRWVVVQARDIKVCSPGIQPRGSLAKMKIASFFVGLLKNLVGEILYDVSYCFVKYNLGHMPWFGQIVEFVAADNLLHAEKPPAGKAEANSVLQIMLDKKLTLSQARAIELNGAVSGSLDQLLDPLKSLHFRIGHQLDVPTLRFTSHMLRTAQIMAARNRNEARMVEAEMAGSNSARTAARTSSLEELTTEAKDEDAGSRLRVLSENDKQLLKNLKRMGFDETVMDAILVIKAAVAHQTNEISAAATWLSGVVENVWQVLFTSGNTVEALASFGVHLKPDAQTGKNGQLTAKVNKFHVSVEADDTPIDLDIFFMDPGRLADQSPRGKES